MAMLMNTYSYNVRTAYDFESALCEAVSFVPHVALLDLSKAEPNGLELAKQFQQMPQIMKTVLIACSGYGQLDELVSSKKAEFSHHPMKPCDPNAVRAMLVGKSPDD